LTSDSTPSARAEWLSGRAETRCTRGARYITGADIIRISRTLALEPWHFTQTAPAGADDPTGVLVDGGRRRVNLKLANAAHGCVFLVRTLSGVGRCGLGDLAPVSCRVFPAHPAAGPPEPRCESEDGGHEQTDQALGHEELTEALRVWAADRDHWYEVVARWNAMAAQSGVALGIEDFQRYLLEAQSAREIGAAWPEEVAA
jgi:hypothetical protein